LFLLATSPAGDHCSNCAGISRSSRRLKCRPPDLLDPLKNADIGPNGRSTLFVVPHTVKVPYSHHYNFSWETELHANWRLQVGYVGSRTHKLLIAVGTPIGANPFPAFRKLPQRLMIAVPDPRLLLMCVPYRNGARAYFDAARISLAVPEWRGPRVGCLLLVQQGSGYGRSLHEHPPPAMDAMQGFSQSQYLVQQDLKAVSAF